MRISPASTELAKRTLDVAQHALKLQPENEALKARIANLCCPWWRVC